MHVGDGNCVVATPPVSDGVPPAMVDRVAAEDLVF